MNADRRIRRTHLVLLNPATPSYAFQRSWCSNYSITKLLSYPIFLILFICVHQRCGFVLRLHGGRVRRWFLVPRLAPFDRAHRADGNSAQHSELPQPHLSFGEQFPDYADLRPGKPGGAIAFSTTASSFALHVIGIFLRRAEKQMVWIHALAHVAAVAHHQFRRNLATIKTPGQAMGPRRPPLDCHGAVAAGIKRAQPQPASVVGSREILASKRCWREGFMGLAQSEPLRDKRG